jgi:hypothetical protein
MADAPGDHIPLGCFDKTVALLVGLGQHIGNGSAKTGLLGDKESHGKHTWILYMQTVLFLMHQEQTWLELGLIL